MRDRLTSISLLFVHSNYKNNQKKIKLNLFNFYKTIMRKHYENICSKTYKTRMPKTVTILYILSIKQQTYIPFEAPFKALAYITERLNNGITVL